MNRNSLFKTKVAKRRPRIAKSAGRAADTYLDMLFKLAAGSSRLASARSRASRA